MGRKAAPQPLALAESALMASDRSPAEASLQISSPSDFSIRSRSPRSPNSPSRPIDKKAQSKGLAQSNQPPLHLAELVNQPYSDGDGTLCPPLSTSAESSRQLQPQPQPQLQLQPSQPPQKHYGHGRYRQNEEKASKSNFFFHFGKSSRSTERLVSGSSSHIDARDIASRGGDSAATGRAARPPGDSYGGHRPHASASDLPIRQNGSTTETDAAHAIYAPPAPPAPPAPTAASTPSAVSTPTSTKKGKPKTLARIGRQRSNRDKTDDNSSSNTTIAGSIHSPSGQDSASVRMVDPPDRAYQPAGPPKTSHGLQHEPSYQDMRTSMMTAVRNQPADRTHPREAPGPRDGGHRSDRVSERDRNRFQPVPMRDNGGSTFFNGLKNSSSRAADVISRGLFGKGGRSGSTTEREPTVDDEHYVLKVINLPLVEQTRLTRISKRLEDSHDKTEFWMPAFPWRAIDYLNFKGTDVEGLYRVPGSGPQIKKWQRRFDEEYDVDLLLQDDLYDINIIGSMLKAWLRELPDELFPKEAQERISRECAGSETVPQLLIDELSELPPFNYYLLFAITCHLSLLLAHSDRNKMDFRNLCICFQPCMKIDAFSFKFLVCDWRDCWQGCRNEMHFIEEEYRIFDVPPPLGIGRPQPVAAVDALEVETAPHSRQTSSSESNQAPELPASAPRVHVRKPTTLETGSVASNSTISTTLTIVSQRVVTPPGQSGDLRPLSPIKPLSPMGF